MRFHGFPVPVFGGCVAGALKICHPAPSRSDSDSLCCCRRRFGAPWKGRGPCKQFTMEKGPKILCGKGETGHCKYEGFATAELKANKSLLAA